MADPGGVGASIMRYFEKFVFYSFLIAAFCAGASILIYLMVRFRNLF